jgi:two-component system, sensor histidine kinase and response regulator
MKPSTPPKARILLVEDNELNQEIALAILGADYAVDVAGNGAEAVEMLRAGGSYDVVLMDIDMPVMDGITATKIIRSMPGMERLPIIALTSNNEQGSREACLAAGMTDRLDKPYMGQELFDAIARAIK